MRISKTAVGAATAVLAVAILGYIGFTNHGVAPRSSAATEASSPSPQMVAEAPSPEPQIITKSLHGVQIPDALDDEGFPGVSLSEALSKLGWTPALPDAALVGTPVKVVLDDEGKDDPATFGLGIKYDSGVKLFIRAGETDFAGRLAWASRQTNGISLGRLEEVGGRASVVSPGGVTKLNRNALVFPKVVTWNLRGHTYSLQSESVSVPLNLLKNTAASIK